MKLLVSITLIVLLAFSQNKDPFKARIITSDIDNFWQAYQQQSNLKESMQALYIEKASPGLSDFIELRINSVDKLIAVIEKRPKYFQQLKESTDQIKSLESKMRSAFYSLAYLYPDAVFPDVYFLIGRMNSGGTIANSGLLIGADMYGLSNETDKNELDRFLNVVLKKMKEVPTIVAHELIHFQQANYNGSNLLALAIREGTADFLAELTTGKHINQHVHDFANPKEEELWLEFKQDMDGNGFRKWLFNGLQAKDKPADLGYWMGYKIVEAYYRKMPDKKQAIADILSVKDYKLFLQKSEYAKKFE